MQYALLLYTNDSRAVPAPDAGGGMSQAVRLKHPDTATTVHLDRGERVIRDGTANGDLMGWLVIECPDLDAAVERAAGLPAARSGQVEIRPVMGSTP